MCYKLVMEKIRHIFEPNPLACGQAVIAMVTGEDVSDIIRLVKTERETTLKDMKYALSRYGFSLSKERMQAQKISDLPETALLSIETPECWHWSLFAHGKVFDPKFGILEDFPISNRKYFWEIKK